MARSYDDECSYLERLSSCSYRIKKGFVPNMKVTGVHGECLKIALVPTKKKRTLSSLQVEGIFYANSHLQQLMFDELRHFASSKGWERGHTAEYSL